MPLWNAVEEDVEKRIEWNLFKRTYPFASLPVQARRKAWETMGSSLSAPHGKEVGIQSGLSDNTPVWSAVGPNPTVMTASFAQGNLGATYSGRINTIAVSPADPQLVLIGAATGGIWRSNDGGESFVPVSDDQIDLDVSWIAFAPSNSRIVYAGMGDVDSFYLGTGVLKSMDAGQTWRRVNNETLPDGVTARLEVDPKDANRVYLAQITAIDKVARVFSGGGLFLSTDGGVNWTKVFTGEVHDLVIHPNDSQTLYLTTAWQLPRLKIGGAPGLYRSTDGGQTWTNIFSSPYAERTYDFRVAVTPADAQRIYIYFGTISGDISLSASYDGGKSWTSRPVSTINGAQFGYNTFLFADPARADTIYVGSIDLYKSTDAGLHWTSAPGLHGDQQSLAFAPTDSNTVYAGDDGGLWKLTSGAYSFRSLNATLSLSQVVGLCVHPVNPAVAYIGTQDNGTQRRQGNTGLWDEFNFGDGGRCVVNPLDPSIVFTNSIAGYASRWTNNTETFGKVITTPTTFGENKTFRIGFYPPFNGNGVDQTLYFGTWRLFKSTDLGDTWSAPATTTDLTKGGRDVLSAIGVARSNTNVIYTDSAGGRAMASTDGGVNWTDVTAGLPNRFIDSLTVDPANPSIAYLTVSGYGSGHVFKTTNTGASWTDVSGNLPNAPTSALLIDPNDSQTIYAGTDIGVFRSITGGTTWETFNNGMPPVIITALAAQANGHIQAATYGRGVYELVTTASGNFSMAAAPAKQFVPAGGKITYTINTATISGSPQTIDLSVSGLPANTTASFNPASITSGASSTLTINIASNTLTADYTLGVTGTGSGGISHYVPLTLSVSASLLNSIDDVRYFVRQQYLDFLNREPDAGGLAYWMQQIAQCGADRACVNRKRVDVSAAFFIEQEFQDTGSFVYRFHKASYGQVPTYARFIADRSR